MKVSIVIPVYNEGGHLAACLEAIAAQSHKPYEVIVVDNNSTDESVAIAASFPFVKIFSESRQGVVYARDSGFNAARGEIIGRIDADTVVDRDWVKNIQLVFADPVLDAVSGRVSYYDLPWRRVVSQMDLVFRQWIATGMGREVFLYGANMALRKSAWLKARNDVCRESGLHEDFDLAIHMNRAGARLAFDRRLSATVSLRRCSVAYNDFLHYVWLNPHTYRAHGSKAQHRMYPVLLLVVAFYPMIRLTYHFYDAKTDSLAFAHLFAKRSALRVNPATYVD